jgi:hypothetical protein
MIGRTAVVGLAGLAGLALVGGWSRVRPGAYRGPRPPPAMGATESERSLDPAPFAARLAAVRRLPRLRTLSALDWELMRAAVSDLTPAQRASLAELDAKARQQAAAVVRLTLPEAQQVEAVYQRSDGELAGLEVGVDPDRGTLNGPIVARLHQAASAELAALTALLGRERARALRRATNLAYRDGWAAVKGGDPALPVVSVARRRMTFLWMGMGGHDAPDPADDER